MLNSQLYLSALILLVTYLVISRIARTYITPLRSVPGPFLARFTRLWELRVVLKEDFATYNIALHKKYGKYITRVLERYLLVQDLLSGLRRTDTASTTRKLPGWS